MAGIWKAQASFNDFLSVRCPPGSPFIPQYYTINFQKGATFFLCCSLMYYYNNFSHSAMCYTAIHGSYGFIWLMKHFAMRDKNWDRKVTFMGAINSFLMVLGPYWLAPYLLISSPQEEAPSTIRVGSCVFFYSLGVVIMMVSDAQKHFTLKVQRGLITDGMFKFIRHPNYLGEMLIYGSFATMAPVKYFPITWGVLAFVWLQLFLPNMLGKEASMSRYPQWKEYVNRSGMLLPPLSSFFS